MILLAKLKGVQLLMDDFITQHNESNLKIRFNIVFAGCGFRATGFQLRALQLMFSHDVRLFLKRHLILGVTEMPYGMVLC